MNAIPLSAWDLAISAALVLAAGLVSLVLGLGLEKKLALAAVRTVLQLLLIGQVLSFIFEIESPLPLVAILLIMIAAAGRAAITRPSRSFSGAYVRAFITLLLTGFLTTLAVTQAVIGVDPWYRPQYIIPLLGMVLGNALTGISLCIDQLLETLDQRRDLIEMELALGATRWEAARRPVSSAVRRGMIPIINSMMVVGIVSLPGMMTGQILAGADPLEAVKYQVVVMFMLAAATSFGCMLMAYLVYQRLFNKKHQLLSDQVSMTD